MLWFASSSCISHFFETLKVRGMDMEWKMVLVFHRQKTPFRAFKRLVFLENKWKVLGFSFLFWKFLLLFLFIFWSYDVFRRKIYIYILFILFFDMDLLGYGWEDRVWAKGCNVSCLIGRWPAPSPSRDGDAMNRELVKPYSFSKNICTSFFLFFFLVMMSWSGFILGSLLKVEENPYLAICFAEKWHISVIMVIFEEVPVMGNNYCDDDLVGHMAQSAAS